MRSPFPYEPAAAATLGERGGSRALERGGFFIGRSSGSHHLLVHRTDPRRRTTVAYHARKDIPRGTLRNILRQAQLTVDEFLSLL